MADNDAVKLAAQWHRLGTKAEVNRPGLQRTTQALETLRTGVWEELNTKAIAEVKEFTAAELDN